jgi:hypothetical protein
MTSGWTYDIRQRPERPEVFVVHHAGEGVKRRQLGIKIRAGD